jgi:glycogen debranching enzyme
VSSKSAVMLQPFLNDETIVLRAPVQAWSDSTGSMGDRPIHGVYLSDTRVVSRLRASFDGRTAETTATVPDGADSVEFVGVLRHLDDETADPRVRVIHRRTVTAVGTDESLTLISGLRHPITTRVTVRLAADLAAMDSVKSGRLADLAAITTEGDTAVWGNGRVRAELTADAELTLIDSELQLSWTVTVPAGGTGLAAWSIVLTDSAAVVAAAPRAADWSTPGETGDDRLDRWISRALVDLDALRMTTVADPSATFLAAGAPWFFTLFGRDSIWSARFLAPLGGTIAVDTLRVLATLQGHNDDPATTEQPGKIVHELRRAALHLGVDDITLPPLYYGTVDATALWVCLLADAADLGARDTELEALLPNLEAALAWMKNYGDADGDGLLEYVSTPGHGLANQGWKDSGDSVQWRDGRLATSPIALCEVQAYAFEAAIRGADLLERFGRDGGQWRKWALRLKARFNDAFWVDDPDGSYPAIALDANKQPVDGLTSNMGHLLGTGLLDRAQSERVAMRLVSPELNSGYGLRTMGTKSAGYWPLSYHGGSVWTHDTAIAIRGLAKDGFADAAAELSEGLLAAAASFEYRMPELHSGDPRSSFSRAVPYPAACRPQAWSAAAAIAVHTARATRRGPQL